MARSSSYVDLYHWSRIQKGIYDNNLGDIGGYRNIILIQPVTGYGPFLFSMFSLTFPQGKCLGICVYWLCYHVSSDVGINWKMRMKVQEIKGFVFEKNWRWNINHLSPALKTQGEKFFFILTFLPQALRSYNHPANHMNICISLNLAMNHPIETGCHNGNLNMKRGTENWCNNKHWSLWGSQWFTIFLVSRTQPWFRKTYVREKRHATNSGKLACTFIAIFSITWAEH